MTGKTIGFYTGRLHNEDSLRNFESIIREGKDRGYNIFAIYVSMGISGGSANDDEHCYTSFIENCDAVIIDGFKITNRTFISKIVREAERQGKPAILFNDIQEDCRCLFPYVEESFNDLLCHLADKHNCKKIDLMLGFSHRWNSDKLISIYQDVLDKYEIERDERRIVYGNYWIEGAQKAAAELLEIDTPDAIVCANDAMAIAVCDFLKKNDIRVPGDVIVTGIDGAIRSENYLPSITTIDKDPHEMAAKVFDDVSILLSGHDTPYMTPVRCNIRYGMSCGCGETIGTGYIDILNRMYAQQEKRVSIEPDLSAMSRKLPEVSEVNDISDVVTEYLPDSTFICVRDSFLQDIYGNQLLMNHDPGKMYILSDTREHAKTWTYFNEKDICPDFKEMIKSDVPVIVSPLFYDNMYFGNWVIHDPDYTTSSSIFDRFITHIEALFARYISERRLRLANCELYHVSAQVKEFSDRDSLTGMLSASGFVRQIDELKKHCIANNEQMVLCCIDIDRLGNINNIYGHFEGDNAIKVLGRIISDAVGDLGLCAHIGGDEFVAALHVKLDAKLASDILFKELDSRVANYNSVSGKEYTIEINQNSTVVDCEKADDMRAVLDQAFSEKTLIKEGRKRVGATSITPDDEEKRLVEDCLDNNKFRYAYQPIVSAKDGSIFAYEALMRAATERFISPLTILKHATDTGRLYDIEKSTFFNVLAQCQSAKDKIGARKIFVNSIPGYQLDDMDYDKLKLRFGELFSNMIVEITEQTEMNDDDFSIIDQRSKADGFQVAIDDFGTGYSNTASLLKYLPGVVKIDRLLIADIHEEPKKQHFVKNIIEFAHDNGFMALAEGVETIGELKTVIHMGIDLIQGFYTAKPDFEYIQEIQPDVIHDIVQANMGEYSCLHKKMFVANGERELPIMRLSLEQYTGIIIAQERITLVGNTDFVAGMTLKIKDDCDCHLTFRDVCITSEDETPCLELGDNVHLTLELVGANNKLQQCGIRVPASSSIEIIGEGDLDISVKNVEAYGIGGRLNESCGSIKVNHRGLLKIKCDGNKCAAIGAGNLADGAAIEITSGHTEILLCCEDSIGIGAVEGTPDIIAHDCMVLVELRVAQGVAVGSVYGCPNIDLTNMRLEILGSGTTLCGIGTLGDVGGDVKLNSGKYIVTLNGNELNMIGSNSGCFKLSSSHAAIRVIAEGNDALGIGTRAMSGILDFADVGISIILRSRDDCFLGAEKENINMVRTTEEYSKT